MKDKIAIYLKQIEQEKNVKILLACETGSRAWGFPSPDSDYDIRIIYVHKKDWYLSLTEEKDTIDIMLENNDIDISGWDLRKSLRLLLKSNPPLLERIQSPIIYQKDEKFLTEINSIVGNFYSRIATMHHYLSMARKSFEDVKDKEKYKLKKFFYALRAAIACNWILEKEEIPPIEFEKMMGGLKLITTIKNRIDELIKLKSTISEAYFHTGEEEILAFIENSIQVAGENAQKLPASKGLLEDLNTFFRKYIPE